MHTFHKQHKLFTYTDESLIKINPNEILVYVYAFAELSEEIAEIRHYPRSEVTPYPIAVEVRFPVTLAQHSTDQLLAGAEALAQVAAVSPDFFNIFGTKKGVNITDLLLVASQTILQDYAMFDYKKTEALSSFCKQSLNLSSVYFYGAATRLLQDDEKDWAAPLLTGKETPYAIYNTSAKSVFDRFCIENKNGKFFVTRVAIEDFLSAPHRFRGVEEVTRPFKAVRGVFSQTFKVPTPGSPYDIKNEVNENGKPIKSLLAPGIWRLRLKLIEEEIFNEPVYVVNGMPPYMTRQDLEPYFEKGMDQFSNSKKIREYLKEKRMLAVNMKLG